MAGNDEARPLQVGNANSVNRECLSDPQGLEALAYNANALKTNDYGFTVRERIIQIITAAGRRHGVTYNQIISPCRVHNVVVARHEAVVEVALAFPNFSFPHLGKIFKRDHSTLMYAFQKLGVPQRTKNPNWAKQYAEARQQVAVGLTSPDKKEVPDEAI